MFKRVFPPGSADRPFVYTLNESELRLWAQLTLKHRPDRFRSVAWSWRGRMFEPVLGTLVFVMVWASLGLADPLMSPSTIVLALFATLLTVCLQHWREQRHFEREVAAALCEQPTRSLFVSEGSLTYQTDLVTCTIPRKSITRLTDAEAVLFIWAPGPEWRDPAAPSGFHG